MRLSRVLFCAILAFIFVFSSLVYAQVPQMINYQGKITTQAGLLIDTTVAMTFSIYADPLGMPPSLWGETQGSVKVEKGVFSVLLGSVNPIPDSVFDGGIRYLAVKVGDDPVMTPLKPIVSVAYAFKSLKADTASYAEGVNYAPLDSRYVNEGQANSITSDMIQDNTIVRADAAFNFKAPYSDTADYALAAPNDNDWVFRITDTADTTLITDGAWGIARSGNALLGNADSTHVNLGVACTTGTSGQDYSYCTVGGGLTNAAKGRAATVGGGRENIAKSDYSTVGGGGLNTASGPVATVGGGSHNTASDSGATVGGGEENTASGQNATVGGGLHSTTSNLYATIGGGSFNTASGNSSTVGGGGSNAASNAYATLGGGVFNAASGYSATIGGGYNDTASGTYTTVGGGLVNVASGNYATVGGGFRNTANSTGANIGGGGYNNASGSFATLPGGYADTVAGDNSFATGYLVRVTSTADFTFAFGNNFTTSASHAVIFHDTQTPIKVGIGTTSPQGALDVNSTTGALIVPRMTTAQRNALTAVNGMIIYNTTTNQFNFYENGAWVTK